MPEYLLGPVASIFVYSILLVSKIQIWALILLQFEYIVRHVPGE